MQLDNIMDYIPSSIFHFDQTDHDHDHDHDDLLQLSYSTATPCHQDNLRWKPCNDLPKKSDDYSQRRKTTNSFTVNDGNPTDCMKRKIIHRAIGRQRRQEMSTLYRALRSLLPIDYLKGNRSISDQLHVAVNYIKDVQNKIQELGEKRDGLRRYYDSPTCSSGSERSQSHPEDNIRVTPCLEGVDVVISTTVKNRLPLSRVLQVLIGEGLSIVNCISTKMNEMFLHNIKTEVNDGRSIDFLDLQQKIMKLTSQSFDYINLQLAEHCS